MNPHDGIDFGQRPATYWEDDDLLQGLLRKVKGTRRRERIERYWRSGQLDKLSGELLQGTVSDEVREALGRIHPLLMSGEYLPDFQEDEAEIARIELQSTLGDVISIRARRDKLVIRYHVVDEYETSYRCLPEQSDKPLTLRQLADLIDTFERVEGFGPSGGPFIWALLGFQDGPPERFNRHFVQVRSEYYPQLGEWWARRLAEREIQNQKERE